MTARDPLTDPEVGDIVAGERAGAPMVVCGVGPGYVAYRELHSRHFDRDSLTIDESELHRVTIEDWRFLAAGGYVVERAP